MQHNFFHVRILFLACILFSVNLTCVQAQKGGNGNNKDEKRENERVRDAERELSEARKQLTPHQSELKAALKKLDAAQDKLVAAKRALREAEEMAEAELGKSMGIPEAIDKVNVKRRSYQKIIQPILDHLHARPEWKTLEAQVLQAKADREVVRQNVELEDSQREEQLKALTQIIDRPVAVENKALQGNPECVAAKQELDKASSELAELRKKLTQSQVEAHPLVSSATKKIKELERTVFDEEKDANKVRVEAAKAQRKVAQAHAELTRAKQADAKDANKNNKKGKNK